MPKHTPLHDEHVSLGAKLVDFAGWEMPINYSSQIGEHNAVREHAGIFDVSHMTVVDIRGAQSRDFLRRVLANDVAKIDADGKALYTCMLNAHGGVVDDLIVYHVAGNWYRAVVNAATTDKDLAWLHSQARDFDVNVERRDELAIVAAQGPAARELVREHLGAALAERAMALKPFEVVADGDWSVGRTGYTGEDGFEIVLPGNMAVGFWRGMIRSGATPVGLGARDTLRLEAGLNLYGQDMDEDHSPLVANLGWTVAFEPEERAFVGRNALEMARQRGIETKLVGVLLEGRGILRTGASVRAAGDDAVAEPSADDAPGELTSGSYAPTLERSIGFARVPVDWDYARVEVGVRGKWQPARVVATTFVRKGKIKVALD
ncbi:glycine cleavage system aminomethyltransferase GcvT [Salinisphaera orenii]|uniref:glycine cleavage system aminomethyltransferase GcvT n=1 Tax=Salinisphaera orenii TaxID=856731 RepID=UPI000DBE38FB